MTKAAIAQVVAWVLIGLTVACAAVATVGFWRLQERIVSLRSEAAALEANKAVTLTGLSDLQMVLLQKVETPKETCATVQRMRDILRNGTSAQREAISPDLFTLLANTCSTGPGGVAGTAHDATRAFVTAYIDALGARLAADYPRSQALYQAALDIPHADEVGAQWRMRALEGVAYAHLKQKRYREAGETLAKLEDLRQRENQKLNIDYMFVFSRLDSIKLMCLTGAKPDEVRAAVTKVRSDFDHYRATRVDAYSRKYADLDRGYIEQDAELFDLCAKAGVKPVALPGPPAP